MSTFPVAGHISDALRTEGEVKADLEATIAAAKQIPGAAQAELTNTISGGSITPAGGGGVVVIDTESAAATDDLTNIVMTNYPVGSMLLIRNADTTRSVVVKYQAGGAGQIKTEREADYTLDDTKKWLLIHRRSSDWIEVMRGPQRMTVPLVLKTGTYTVTKADHGNVILCSGTFTVNLLAAAAAGNGFTVGIHNVGAGLITVDPNSSELIDGASTVALSAGNTIMATSDAVDWYSAVSGVHYTDGPWTPVLTFDTPGNLTVVYDVQTGRWIKIGRHTTAWFQLRTTTFTHTTASGQMKITGLVHDKASTGMQDTNGGLKFRGITKANFTQFAPFVDNGQQYINVFCSGSAQTPAVLSTGDMPTAGTVELRGSVTYEAAS